ncbi:MAG: hypothetical protein DRR04_01160 [Gammaproteobacteria bacterium]|nr:MAG: hypothetical protein DRQ97_03805 [Gammaproteobacteria bacterium]RLA62089.1 MAG: hypothetical protein DRR04_01160 [Gammaproteobacteria bacterium]
MAGLRLAAAGLRLVMGLRLAAAGLRLVTGLRLGAASFAVAVFVSSAMIQLLKHFLLAGYPTHSRPDYGNKLE